MLKALALGADAAPLYGLSAAGAAGAARALEILKSEALDGMGLLGVSRVDELGPHLLAHSTPSPSPRGTACSSAPVR
jgi:(S)-mandelate dehydrogenase